MGCASCGHRGSGSLAGGDFGHQWTRHGTYAAELQRYVELVGHDAGRGDPHRQPQHGRRSSASTSARSVRASLADLLVRRRRPDRRHHRAPAARAPARGHQGRRLRVRQPRRSTRDRRARAGAPAATRTILSGVDTLVRLLVLRHQLDERDGLHDRDDGLRVSGITARPASTSPLERLDDVLADHRDPAPPGPERGARRGHRLGEPDGCRGRRTRVSTASSVPGTARRPGSTVPATR